MRNVGEARFWRIDAQAGDELLLEIFKHSIQIKIFLFSSVPKKGKRTLYTSPYTAPSAHFNQSDNPSTTFYR